jgi:prepilin-type N-terminal cleavage/methylation domain-containing protein
VRTRRDDAGVTLIEVVVAIALLGLAAVAVLGAFATLSVTSTRHRDLADVQSVLASAAEMVTAPSTTRVACASPSNYQTAARAAVLPASWSPNTVLVTAVQYWDGTNFGSACYDSKGFRLQKITISVTSMNGRAAQSVDVYKGDEVVGDG